MQWEEVPAYTVPPEFDKTCLGAVDMSSKEKARRSLPQAFKRRWLDLRSQVTQALLTLLIPDSPNSVCNKDCHRLLRFIVLISQDPVHAFVCNLLEFR